MDKIFKYPLLIIISICVITIFLGFQIKNLVIDNDTTTFLPKDNPSRMEYHKIENVYGGNMIMAVSIKVKNDFIYSKKNLEIIKSITDEIEQIQDIDKVTSLTNVSYITGNEEGIISEKLIQKMPENEEEENEIKEKLLSWKPYKGALFSSDFKSTMIAIKLSLGIKNEHAEKAYYKVKKILNNYKQSGFEFYVAGLPTVLVIIAKSLRQDLARLVPFVVIILLVTLFISFRTIGGVILPTITVLITTICVLGIMSLFKINLTMIASAIPVLMIAVGSAYGIHLISHYYDEIDNEIMEKGNITEEKHKEIIFLTIKRVGGAIFLAALTTMAGFGSLATSKIVPLKEFGIFTAVGVFIALIIAILLIPSILILRHRALKHNINKKNNSNNDIVTKFLLKLYNLLSNHKTLFLFFILFVFIITIYGTSKIIIGNPMINYFRKNTEIRKADDFANKNFNGTTLLDIVIKGKEAGALTEPEILYKIDNLITYLENKYKDIGNILSFTDLIKKMNQVMNADEKGNYYEIPYDPQKYRLNDKKELKQLIAQYLLLFSGNINDLVDDSIEPSQTKLTIMLKNPDFDLVRKIKSDIYQWAKTNISNDYEVIVTGNAELQVVVSNLIVDSQISNIISSLIAIFLILSIYFKSPIAGLFGVFTLIIPILLNFAVMGFLKIKLDAGTSMVASVCIGIGIDYTIHFINAYHYERKKSNDLETVTNNSLKTTGKSIVFNAAAVAFGFLVLVFSNFMPLVSFGALIAFTMFTSSISAMTLLPVMLNIFKPKFITK